jgi:protein-L-isoaspartate O-methyltransferase
MTRAKRQGALVLLAALAGWLGSGVARAQSLAEVARAAKEKKEASTRAVWTNEDLRERLLELKLLRTPREHPPVLAPYVVTPPERVRQMLRAARVKPGELVVDIGSGDGRILIVAAEEFGARGIGIEIDPELVAHSRSVVAARGLDDRVSILHANALDVDISPADVVTAYLTVEGMAVLRPYLERMLRPGTRVASYVFRIPGWEPAEESLPEEEIWLYRVP